MNAQLANPLLYPLSVLAGGITLFVGVRLAQLPSAVMLPAAIVVAAVTASWKARQPESLNLVDNPELERELQSALASARQLVEQANVLRLEATNLLTNSLQMELLAAVHYACERTLELPVKIDQMARRLQGSDSLLSVNDLQRQSADVQAKLNSSTGVAREHLNQLEQSLQRNIQLARQGQDARQAQVVSLATLIQDAAGVLQQLQNQLRVADLNNSSQLGELRLIAEEFRGLQENVELLTTK